MLALSVFFLLFGVVCFAAAIYFILEIDDKDKDRVRLYQLAGKNKAMYHNTKRNLDALIQEYDQSVDGKYNHPATGRFCSKEEFYKAVFYDA